MLLEARNVTKAFGSFKAVDAASVTLEQGDILGLIGPNGAGKSTLFNCLTGDLLSTSGKVLFEGHDITNLTPEARAHLGLARTFQVPQTFEGMSVLENVMIGAFLRTSHRAEAETRARAVLERVGMSRLADAPAAGMTAQPGAARAARRGHRRRRRRHRRLQQRPGRTQLPGAQVGHRLLHEQPARRPGRDPRGTP